MSRPMTRRLAAKLLLAAPAALAAPALVATERPSKARRSALSASEKRQLDKSVEQFRSLAAKIREMKIPIGTEPAFVFRPLVSKK